MSRVRPLLKRTLRCRVEFVIALAVVAGCGESPEGGYVDWAGNPERYTLVTEVGTGGDEVSFGAIVPGAFTPTGTLWVGDYFSGEIMELAIGSGSLQRLGGTGAGPGEFAELHRIGMTQEGSVWVTDRRTGRVTVFHMDGDRSTFGFLEHFFAAPLKMVGPTALLADGTVVVIPDVVQTPTAFPDTLVAQPVIRVARTGEVVDTLIMPSPAPIGSLELPNVPGILRTSRVLNERPLVSVAPDGSRVGVVDRLGGVSSGFIGRLYLADIPSGGVDTLSIPGRAERGTSQEVLRRVRELELSDGISREQIAEEIAGKPLGVPEWLSTISGFRVASDGTVWIGMSDERHGDQHWMWMHVDEGDWTPVELVTDKRIFRLIDAQGDRVAAILMDDLRVQTLGIFERGEDFR